MISLLSLSFPLLGAEATIDGPVVVFDGSAPTGISGAARSPVCMYVFAMLSWIMLDSDEIRGVFSPISKSGVIINLVLIFEMKYKSLFVPESLIVSLSFLMKVCFVDGSALKFKYSEEAHDC